MTKVSDFIDVPPAAWTGRHDGAGEEHLRWHERVRLLGEDSQNSAADVTVLGFASDEGVERNQGRRGAAEGPAAIRSALGSLSLLTPVASIDLADAGDVTVTDDRLEEGQERLGQAVAAVIDSGSLPIVFGGGHEIAFGTYRGVARSARRSAPGQGSENKPAKLGVLNLDAHFDLRSAPRATSGTGFRQLLELEEEQGSEVSYAVVGISEAANTQALFDTAEKYGVKYLLDTDCGVTRRAEVLDFVQSFLAENDLIYLTVDLDVLPAATAPGVSAPAARGVHLEIIEAVCDLAAASPKLAAADIAELNPAFDLDGRTAKTAARLAHRIATHHFERKIHD